MSGNQNKGSYADKNRSKFSKRFADFVLIDRNTGKVHAVVQMEGGPSARGGSKVKDAERDDILSKVGILVFRVDARKARSVAQLRAQITVG